MGWGEPDSSSIRAFRWSSFGPFVVGCDLEGSRAVDVRGRQASHDGRIREQSWDFGKRLRAGLDVRLDGRLVARLSQTKKRLSRSGRVIRLQVDPASGLIPGAYFRFRGFRSISLETARGSLVRSPWWDPSAVSGTLSVADGVSADMVLVYTLVARTHGYEALQWP